MVVSSRKNVLNVEAISAHLLKQGLAGKALLLDFKKAFDSLEWHTISAALKQHGFGPKLISWVQCFQSNPKSCIINSGHFCQFFNIARGVRPGCPLSPYIFILTIEVLANAIRNNNKLKGVSIFSHSAILNLYADDVTLFLQDNQPNIDECLKFIKEFGAISGLKLNQSKTEYLNLGISSNSQSGNAAGGENV